MCIGAHLSVFLLVLAYICVFLRNLAFSWLLMRIWTHWAYASVFLLICAYWSVLSVFKRFHAYSCIFLHIPDNPCVLERIGAYWAYSCLLSVLLLIWKLPTDYRSGESVGPSDCVLKSAIAQWPFELQPKFLHIWKAISKVCIPVQGTIFIIN